VKTRLLLALCAALAVPSAAWAHANLVRTQPADGAVLARAPAAVRVVFDDVVHTGPGIEAVRNGGGSVLAGRAHVEGGRTLVVPVRAARDGAYSVRWSIVSDDGHLESGVLAFAVGRGQPAPTATLSARGGNRVVDDAPGRWLFLAGVLGAVGIALLALVARVEDDTVPLVLSTAAVLAALGAAEGVHRVGTGTRAGTAFGAGFVAAVVVATLASAALLDRRVLRPALVLALGLAAVPPVAGHALDQGLDRVNLAADILHVAGAAAWAGALLGLLVVRAVPQRRAIGLAVAGVLVLAATGVVRASFELLRVSQLWDTSYGRALLVKTGLLLFALAAGWLLRARVRARAGVELVLVAGILVAVSVLVLLRPGRNVVAAPARTATPTELSPAPPRPPAAAIVAAHELGAYGVALAAEPRRLTVLVLSPAGGGASGLDVTIDGKDAASCGSGCYRLDSPHRNRTEVSVDGARTTFRLPLTAPSGLSVLRSFARQFRGSLSVAYAERLASDPTHVVVSRWRLERPNRVQYVIPGGAQGIVIGDRRWDRDGPNASWTESAQSPLPQPSVPWNEATNVRLVSAHHVLFVDPAIPAYFDLEFHRAPTALRMVAAAHFMTDRYVEFNGPRAIRPPR
jgi:copper transport protein